MSGDKIVQGLRDAIAGNFSRVEMGSVAWLRFDHQTRYPRNARAWAIGRVDRAGRFKVRRIVWGRLLARYEKQIGESIRQAAILVSNNERVAP